MKNNFDELLKSYMQEDVGLEGKEHYNDPAQDLADSIEDAKNDDDLIYILQHIRREGMDMDVIHRMSDESKNRALSLLFRFFTTIPDLRNY
jgi:hypothetical protein